MNERPTIIDVIILSNAKNDGLKAITEKAINSLITSEDSNNIKFNILVIESNRKLKKFQYQHTTTHYPKERFGYNRYINIGLKMTSNSYVCISNNDLIFHPGWASEILNAFRCIRDLSSACPLCTIHHPKVQIKANSGYHFGYEIRRQLVGWCFMIRREILKTIGQFDPKFTFWYADNDYANTLRKHNLKHALVTSSLVDHLESQTLRQASHTTQLTYTLSEKYYFNYKWNGVGLLHYKLSAIRLKVLITCLSIAQVFISLKNNKSI